jgi:hypothetical protein
MGNAPLDMLIERQLIGETPISRFSTLPAKGEIG